MEQEIEWLKNRVAVLEELVETLLGKAIADSGQMHLLLEDVVAINSRKPETTDQALIDDHLHLQRHVLERVTSARDRASYFPRKWKSARRLRETDGVR